LLSDSKSPSRSVFSDWLVLHSHKSEKVLSVFPWENEVLQLELVDAEIKEEWINLGEENYTDMMSLLESEKSIYVDKSLRFQISNLHQLNSISLKNYYISMFPSIVNSVIIEWYVKV